MRYLASGKFIFLCFFIFYAALGYCFTYILEIYHNDALARTALAFFTTYGRDPHLAAIGFVWQPLPSLLQIPFIQLLKPLNLMFMAGPLVSSICGALCVALIYKIGQLILNNKTYSTLIITLLFGLNPLIILYSAIGTSETVFLLCVILSSYFLIRYYYSHDQTNLLLAGFAISLSFWSRYEAIPAFLGSLAVLFLNLKFLKGTNGRLESTLLQFALPFIYSILLWIFVNWLIMKDPFYFLSSPYSNAAYTSVFRSGSGVLENSYFSALNSLSYVVNRTLYLAPVIWLLPVLGIPVTQSHNNRLKNLLLLTFLTFPFIAILIFHSYQLFKGESFGWLRFFMYALPLGTFFAFYLTRRHILTGILAVSLMAVGIYTTWYAMNDGRIGSEENTFTRKLTDPTITLDFSRTFIDQKEIAAFMDGQPGLILIDSGEGFAIPMFSKQPDRFVITSDEDYKEIVQNYPAKVDWIIIHQPKPENPTQNLIYQYYPAIWDGNAPNLVLHTQIQEWRIFKVNKSSSS